MWDSWEIIAQAQAAADQKDAERREERTRPRASTPAQETPEPTQQAIGWDSDTWGKPDPTLTRQYREISPGVWDYVMAPKPPFDPVPGIRLYLKALQNDLDALEEDTDG